MLSHFDVRRSLRAANDGVEDRFIGDPPDKATRLTALKPNAIQIEKNMASAFLAAIDVAVKIRAAVLTDPQSWLSWSALQAQSNTDGSWRREVSSRVVSYGYGSRTGRMNEIAAALNTNVQVA